MSEFKDGIKMKGHWHIVLRDEYGNIKEERHQDNMIVDTGFEFIQDVIGEAAQPAEMDSMEIGTGTTAVVAGDTDLEAADAAGREAATYARTSAKVFTFTNQWAAGVATAAITEAGIFNGGGTVEGAGIMLNRVVFSVVNKGALDTLDITFTFTMS
jgi:hypothetical protein